MEFYRFMSLDGRSRALTADRYGDALPERRWIYLGPMPLGADAPGRLGVTAEHVADRVARDGYFILPPLPRQEAGLNAA